MDVEIGSRRREGDQKKTKIERENKKIKREKRMGRGGLTGEEGEEVIEIRG